MPGAALGAGDTAVNKTGKHLAPMEPMCQWSHSSEFLCLFFLPFIRLLFLFSYLSIYVRIYVLRYQGENPFLISINIKLLWVLFRISLLSWRYFRWSISTSCCSTILKVSWAAFLSGGLTGEESAFKLTQLVGRNHFLAIVEYGASIPCWLLTQGCSWFLEAAHGFLPCGFFKMEAYYTKLARRISR